MEIGSDCEISVIGLDLSLLSTGICILSGYKESSDPKISSKTIKKQKPSDISDRTKTICSISDEICNVVIENSPRVIVSIEAPAVNQKWQAATIGEIHGVVRRDLFKIFNILPYVNQATKMRKEVVGKISSWYEDYIDSNGKKKRIRSYGMVQGKRGPKRATVKDVVESRLADHGLSFSSNDEMDAYVAAKYIWNEITRG